MLAEKNTRSLADEALQTLTPVSYITDFSLFLGFKIDYNEL